MKYRIVQAECFEALGSLRGSYTTCLADPPDGIGLGYDQFKDKWKGENAYAEWLVQVTQALMDCCSTVWVSYNARHDVSYKAKLWERWGESEGVELKPFVQTITFGQYRKEDCANNHRPLMRLRYKDAPLLPNQILVPSWRELNGDKRAKAGGRVPGDAWDFPRVTGNSKQRRKWHPTQLSEDLVTRAIMLTTPPDGKVLDMFSGTGTTMRVCKRLGIACTSVELSSNYCKRIAKENDVALFKLKSGKLVRQEK